MLIRVRNTAFIDPLEKPLPVNFRKNQDEIFSKLLVSLQQNIYLHWLTLGEYGTLVRYRISVKAQGTCASFKHVITSNLQDTYEGWGSRAHFLVLRIQPDSWLEGSGIKVMGPGNELIEVNKFVIGKFMFTTI